MIIENQPFQDVVPMREMAIFHCHVSFWVGCYDYLLDNYNYMLLAALHCYDAGARHPLWTERILNKAGGSKRSICQTIAIERVIFLVKPELADNIAHPLIECGIFEETSQGTCCPFEL